jgi:manganese/zinc/iron transport system permease protein
MACALPGTFLLLRRQSMLGDALSHTALLGVVLAFFTAHALHTLGWATHTDSAAFRAFQQVLVLSGAVLVGILTAWLTEWIQRLGRVESSAALGVVFVSLFALALLLIGVFGRQLHLDTQCVLLGELESEVGKVVRIGTLRIREPALVNGAVLMVNLLLTLVFFKELRIAAFDPHLATTQGIPARAIHYGLMAVTAVTIVAAFRSVGSILVIAMLITPAATARLLSDGFGGMLALAIRLLRLPRSLAHVLSDQLGQMVVLSLLVAALSGVLGHVLAIAAPLPLLSRLGFPGITSVSTTGMIALAAGLMFVLAVIFAPQNGLLSKLLHRALLGLRIAGEDILGALYRIEETQHGGDPRLAARWAQTTHGLGRFKTFVTVFLLRMTGKVAASEAGLRLTAKGRRQAENLVRSHRLWESFLAARLGLPEDHVHDAAERVEHFVGPSIREELQIELEDAAVDPHGKAIPREAPGGK